ncbi:hypothetical protein JOD54_000415 [Actinokineospora baliensis]|uniref:protein-tyrosine phosphatase family protein n=1 Tax=Actinokineospora baliensis TaxID=547056 RepID=UPI00195E083A|nr:protein-tyrosine phosphatase family protein [Actinokineospora baliensis]MBM7770211.1 hypothetical protein [Actinokineospora baliensis]
MTSPTPVDLPDGTRVRARGLRNGPITDAPDYGLYLGGSRLRRYEPTLTWPHTWIDWPDFWLPRDRSEAIRLIKDAHVRAASGEVVEIACGGGIGRTGTVLSCLAILSGVAPAEAVAWTRKHYLPGAVETPWQKRWVEKFI